MYMIFFSETPGHTTPGGHHAGWAETPKTDRGGDLIEDTPTPGASKRRSRWDETPGAQAGSMTPSAMTPSMTPGGTTPGGMFYTIYTTLLLTSSRHLKGFLHLMLYPDVNLQFYHDLTTLCTSSFIFIHCIENRINYSQLLSQLCLSQIFAYLEVKIWSLF